MLQEMRIGESRENALKKLAAADGRAGGLERSCARWSRPTRWACRSGGSCATQATDSRLKRQAAAEERAMKAPVKMLIPTVLFIFPSMFLVMLGPAFMMTSSKHAILERRSRRTLPARQPRETSPGRCSRCSRLAGRRCSGWSASRSTSATPTSCTARCRRRRRRGGDRGREELPTRHAQAPARAYGGSAGGKNDRATTSPASRRPRRPSACSQARATRSTRCVTVRESTDGADVLRPRRRPRSFDHVTARATACSPCARGRSTSCSCSTAPASMCWDHSGRPDPACTDLNNARDGHADVPAVHGPGGRPRRPRGVPARLEHGATSASRPDSSSYDSTVPRRTSIAPLSTDYLLDGALNTVVRPRLDDRRASSAPAARRTRPRSRQAQAELDAHGRPNVQDVIVFLSDGAANYGPRTTATRRPTGCSPATRASDLGRGIKARGR